MTKKVVMIMTAFILFLSFITPDLTDAKRRGGGGSRSGTSSFMNPNKSTTSDYKKSDTTSTHKSPTGSSTGGNASRGFFSGGSLMKGLMIGGLAGILFGGLFSGMGFFGNLLGMAVNLFAIYAIIMIAVALYRRFKNQPNHNNYNQGGRY